MQGPQGQGCPWAQALSVSGAAGGCQTVTGVSRQSWEGRDKMPAQSCCAPTPAALLLPCKWAPSCAGRKAAFLCEVWSIKNKTIREELTSLEPTCECWLFYYHIFQHLPCFSLFCCCTQRQRKLACAEEKVKQPFSDVHKQPRKALRVVLSPF